MANVWDALKNTVDKTVDSYTKMKNAENEFKSSLLLAKIKSQWEMDAKKEEKQTMTPLDQMQFEAMQEIRNKMKSGEALDYDITPEGKIKRLELDDKVKRIYEKDPSTWTIGEQSLVKRHQAMKSSIGGQTNVRNSIMLKVQRGEKLSPGELQLYNDTIKKKSDGGLGDILSEEETQNTNPELDDLFKGL